MANAVTNRLIALAAVALFVVAAIFILRSHAARGQFEHSSWRAISGDWTFHGSVVSNAHYGRGDMMIIQHPAGRDYRIAADVRFDLLFTETHYGDAGLIIRTTDPQAGVDSYNGYYAGLRPDNQTLVLGRASNDWHLLSEVKLAAPVASGDWYHLELAARGCELDVLATPLDRHPATEIHYQDANCLTAGVGGLRSFYAHASWRNVAIDPL
jgi:hypothetical protein